jgi:hypothetical protein
MMMKSYFHDVNDEKVKRQILRDTCVFAFYSYTLTKEHDKHLDLLKMLVSAHLDEITCLLDFTMISYERDREFDDVRHDCD